MLLRKSDFSNIGQPRTSPSGLLCPLTPAADIAAHGFTAAWCH
jgi:hypothetical protein